MDEVAAAIAGELRLLEPAVRRSRAELERLLDPDFVEVGASGRRYTRADMLDELPRMAGESPVAASGMHGVVLAPGLVHLTYETTVDGRRVRRSSLWRHGRVYYHQGTPVPAG